VITKDQARHVLEELKDDLEHMLKVHKSYKAADPQYDDPAMWWGEVMLMDINLVLFNQNTRYL